MHQKNNCILKAKELEVKNIYICMSQTTNDFSVRIQYIHVDYFLVLWVILNCQRIYALYGYIPTQNAIK